MKQEFNIMEPHTLEFIEDMKDGKLYRYGNFGVLIDNDVSLDLITNDKIIETYKEIAAKLVRPYTPEQTIAGIHFTKAGDSVKYTWSSGSAPGFERIRRITGYLVGTTDRFNNAKRAEESERRKHSF